MSQATEARTGVVHAAGAVTWRDNEERLEVALVHRPRYKDWSWPKGKLEVGESLPAAAVREVEEEIGSPVVLGMPLPGLSYQGPDGRRKQVHYWAARDAGRADAPALAARAPVQRAERDEVDDVVWVGAATARDMLTRRADRAPLDALHDAWTRGRLATRTLVIARHGRARRRSAWSGAEGDRPLTPKGHAQAWALVPVLAAFGVTSVVSSPWERCRRSIQPYAERAGVPVQEVAELTEAHYREHPDLCVEIADRLLADPHDVVVCTHRPVLPAFMDAIAESSRRWTAGTVPAKDPYLHTGEALVTHVAGAGAKARVVAVERHRPPSAV